MSDPQVIGRFGERMRMALAGAISEAFGGSAEAQAVVAGGLSALVADLGEGHHLHLELEASTGRQAGRSLLVVLRAADGERVFGLEPTDAALLSDATTQLRLLAEFTEGAEVFAAALAGALASVGALVSLRVAGASLEEAAASPTAAATALGSGDSVACVVTVNYPPGAPLTVVIGAPVEVAALIGGAASERAAAGSPAARSPKAEGGPDRRTAGAPAATPAPAAVTAHPFAFGQLEPAAAATRSDRGVDLILDVALQVRVELGSTRMTVEEVLALGPGSIVELDRLAGEPVDIVINDRLIARGEVVVVEENFGVRVTEIVTARARVAVGG